MIVAVTSQKGGSGKTTTSLCLADALTRQGKRVLLADADPQGSLAVWALRARDLGEGDYPVLIADGGLDDAVLDHSRDYDVTIIDCPPRLDAVTRSALMAADVAVVPARPSTGDLDVLGDTLALIKRAQDVRPQLKAAILVNQRPARSALADDAVEAMRTTGTPVLDTSFGFRVAFMEAHAAGTGPIGLDPRSRAAKEVASALSEILSMVETH